MKAIGVDGCRGGWVAVACTDGSYACAVYADFAALMEDHIDADRIYIDIPIGLPHAAMPRRVCDSLARKILGTRASSVFSPPCRAAVYADSYAQAKALNEAEVGMRFSIQAWGICKKIAEVDRYLQANPGVLPRLREAHPELAFWQLNGQRPLRENKKSEDGAAQRMQLLETVAPGIVGLMLPILQSTRRAQLQPDDVWDAVALCLRAQMQLREEAQKTTLAKPTAKPLGYLEQPDARGLPMCIYY
jgi:predicted RNase H-like nuclease